MLFIRILLVISIIQTIGFSATIRGNLKDTRTQEDIIGAAVFLENTDFVTTSDLYGNYILSDIPEGSYTLIAKYLGYELLINKKISVKQNDNLEINLNLNQTEHKISEVEISGKVDKEEDSGARLAEKNAPNVMNIVSAKTIERSPDITVAQVAQRVSGITLDRSSDGQSQYAIVRGIEQRYNNTLINGIKIPSPDSKNRFVPLDIIPAELLQRLEVAKGLTPEMEGDAIGGSINAVLKDAPDTMLVKVNLATGYNQINIDRKFASFDRSTLNYSDPDQQHPGLVKYAATGNDFNKKILDIQYNHPRPNLNGGIILGNRFFKKKLGVLLSVSNQNNFSGSQSSQFIPLTDKNNNIFTGEFIDRQIHSNANRLGINAKIDFHINTNHKITAYNLYLQTSDAQVRTYSDTANDGNGRYGPGTGYVFNFSRSRYYIQTVQSTSLRGDHLFFDKWKLDWTVAYSQASGQLPDMAELQTHHTVQPDGSFLGGNIFLNGVSHTWQKNTDKDYSGYLNLERKIYIRNHSFVFKTGGLVRHKDRMNYQNDYNLNSAGVNAIYTNVYDIVVKPYQNTGNPIYNKANYTATEDITAFYFQGMTNIGKLEILTGARYELTNQSNHNIIPQYPGFVEHFFQYGDLLPSLNLKYALNNKNNFRVAYYKAISRPNYYEIIDYQIQGDGANQKGNPKLQRTQADNFDIRYEFYPKSDEVIMAGVFYKNMENPIEQVVIAQGGVPTTTFRNFGTAKVMGFELSLIKYFGRFGISGNFTFSDSKISSTKILYVTADSNQIATYPLQSRPLQGQSKEIVNLSLLYRDKINKFNVQVALLIQGNRISNVSPNYNQDYYQKDYYDLSFSADKSIGKYVNVYIKLNNLLNTPNLEKLPNGFFIQKYTFGQNYLIGLRFTI